MCPNILVTSAGPEDWIYRLIYKVKKVNLIRVKFEDLPVSLQIQMSDWNLKIARFYIIDADTDTALKGVPGFKKDIHLP